MPMPILVDSHGINSHDIIALVITILLGIIHFLKRGYITRTAVIYRVLLLMNGLSVIFYMLANMIAYKYPGHNLLWGLTLSVCLMAYMGHGAAWYYFVLYSANGENNSYLERSFGNIVYASICVLILTSSFTGLIYQPMNAAHPGMAEYSYLINLAGVCFIGMSFLSMVENHKQYSWKHVAVFCFVFVEYLVMAIFQFFHRNMFILQLLNTVANITVYVALEDPEKYLYRVPGCYNPAALKAKIYREIDKPQDKGFILFKFENFDYVSHKINENLLDMLESSLIENFHIYFNRKDIFCLSEGNIVVYVAENARKTAEHVLDEYPRDIRIDGMSFNVIIKAYYVRLNEFKSAHDILRVLKHLNRRDRNGSNNPVVQITKRMLRDLDRELDMVKYMQEALVEGGFEVFYQPIYDVKKGCFPAAEALVRLRDSYGELVYPGAFIPLAEHNGLIVPIGEFVFENVCRFYMENKLFEKGVRYIEINLSAIQLMQQGLGERFGSILHKYDIRPANVNLEITETTAVDNISLINDNILTLKELGVSLSIDDFGSGYASMSYLNHLPASIVKIDKCLVDDAMKSASGRIVLSKTMETLKALEFEVVAEGIESKEAFELLKGYGCDYIQGFLFSKPLSAKDYLEFLEIRENKEVIADESADDS
ncbi:MAG: EAL domain-containing protein [Lachnospiraceae bacterium]|nr:EAL domain-containing protein [Lachnospiraceae bacterium]